MTSNHDGSYRSMTGAPESAEPPQTNSSSQATIVSTRDSSANKAQPPASASVSGSGGPAAAPSRSQTLNGVRSLNTSGSPSTANSPMSSRDTSPARPTHRQPASAGPLPRSGLRSRKSSTDVSPNRGPSLPGSGNTVPSAAAIQRALSSATVPQLQPASSQDPSRVPRPSKPASGQNSGDSTPHWPISPRLKSPPPATDARSRSRRDSLGNQHKKPEPAPTPSIVVQSSSPASASRIPVKDEGVNSDQEEQPLSMKGSSRGASGAAPKLETVQEASLPTTPGFDNLDIQSLPTGSQSLKTSDDERNDVTSSKVTEDLSAKPSKNTESGSDSGINKSDKGKMQEQRSVSAQRPSALPSKASFTSLSAIKSRPETSTRNMTVETETVPSIAHATIGNQERAASGRGDGSLRLKASNETIRPKKEKQKPKRKAPSINSGTASSKQDVFEQKVASAVDEANSSDSDDTFIYESNPPEAQPHRSRHHSRTPSMTSVASLVDPRAAIREANKNPHKKVSMKFNPNPHNGSNVDYDGSERGDGTMRGSGRAGGGGHHHHIGRHGQTRGALSHVLVDSDSSMAHPSRARGPSSRYSSQPNSPRFHTFNMGNGNGNGSATKKHGEYSTYDIDTENAADDERTPLISSVRSPRHQNRRQRNNVPVRHIERRQRHSGGWCRRFAGCLVLSIIVILAVFCAMGLVFATSKPLNNVQVREIQNVIASQEELMLDLLVDAVNPNMVSVTIADMDVNIFAKSKHVGSDRWWREHGGRHNNDEIWHPISEESTEPVAIEELAYTDGGVDEGTDPIKDPEVGEPRTMLLGRIFHFDSPLNFEGSFFKRQNVSSLGGMRLSKPGNKTEAGGTERWEAVLEYPFELIVRGVFKYQLPLSTREHSVSITATYFYDPDEEKKKKLKLSATDPTTGALLPTSVKLPPTPLGRYDVRARSTPLLLDP